MLTKSLKSRAAELRRTTESQFGGYPGHYGTGFSQPSDLSGKTNPMKTIQRFLADDTGATAIEYGLIAAGIALAIIAIVNGLGAKLNTKFTSINSSLK